MHPDWSIQAVNLILGTLLSCFHKLNCKPIPFLSPLILHIYSHVHCWTYKDSWACLSKFCSGFTEVVLSLNHISILFIQFSSILKSDSSALYWCQHSELTQNVTSSTCISGKQSSKPHVLRVKSVQLRVYNAKSHFTENIFDQSFTELFQICWLFINETRACFWIFQ